MRKKKIRAPSPERMQEIAWEVGKKFPAPLTVDYIAVYMVHPGLGHVHWHIGEKTLAAARVKEAVPGGARLVVRIHDVTDIIFDGSNSHTWFDLEVGRHEGNYYFGNTAPARNYMAEMGLRGPGGFFHPLLTSNTAYFGRNRRSGRYSTEGLFGGGMLDMRFPVENIFDAPVYERMNRELAGIDGKGPLHIAVVLPGSRREAGVGGRLDTFIRNLSAGLGKFGVSAAMFSPRTGEFKTTGRKAWADRMRRVSKRLCDELTVSHGQAPFDLIHCHDRRASQAALAAAARLRIPLVLSLHSTEYERGGRGDADDIPALICSWERKAVHAAALVIVPHESARAQVTGMYGASPEKMVVIPDVPDEESPDVPGEPSAIRYRLNLPPDVPVVLFAGEMSHAAGADLLLDALPTVCRNHGTAHFVFAGDGPLKDELEERARRAGISGRCRFIGHVSHRDFMHVLLSSDFVVIPARTWQDEALARMAIEHGRPVLTTHQAGIKCVTHGGTGLVTFDNPGSIVWGIQEMLFNPLRDSMLQAAARKSAGRGPSLESAAVQHYMYYRIVLGGGRGHA